MQTLPYEVEICVDSVDAAKAAQQHGAHRVELCARLDLHGLNPSLDTIKEVREAIDIDLHVIIRPRAGNFTYTLQEVELMIKSIRRAKELGVNGIVAGALMSDGKLDIRSTASMIKAAHPCSFTFHRAFDMCWDPLFVFEYLDKLGVDRLLTSGHEKTAMLGLNFLSELSQINAQTELMAGGGVNQNNVQEIWNAGIRQFHFSCQKEDENGQLVFDHEKAYLTIEALDKLSK